MCQLTKISPYYSQINNILIATGYRSLALSLVLNKRDRKSTLSASRTGGQAHSRSQSRLDLGMMLQSETLDFSDASDNKNK